MYYNSIFQQLFNVIPRYRFEKSVKNLSGDHYCKTFSTWQQFLTCLYVQITGKDSLREIKEPGVAIVSCNDGLRPVIMKLEATDEEARIEYIPITSHF